MELNRKNMKRIMLLIAFGLVLSWGLHNTGQLSGLLSGLLGLLAPFLLGLCMAFVLNLVLCPLERGWRALWKKSKSPLPEKCRRPVCLTLAVLLLAGAFSTIFFVLIPQISATVASFSDKLPEAMERLEQWWADLAAFAASYNFVLPSIDIDLEKLIETVSTFLSERGARLFGKTMDITISIVSAVVNFFLGLVFSLYVLAQKEQLGENAKKLMYAGFPERTAGRILRLLSLTGDTFSRFVSGQVTEALILGSLCFVGMSVFRLPYALVVSVVICFSALVPIFGAWIGAAVGAFLIVFVSPLKALWFLLFLVVLQQLEGNLIYPRVVGKSVGLPGIWVLVAVTIGGGAFGVTGMLFGVPIFSVLYTLAGRFVRRKTEEREARQRANSAPGAAEADKAPESAR